MNLSEPCRGKVETPQEPLLLFALHSHSSAADADVPQIESQMTCREAAIVAGSIVKRRTRNVVSYRNKRVQPINLKVVGYTAYLKSERLASDDLRIHASV